MLKWAREHHAKNGDLEMLKWVFEQNRDILGLPPY